MASPRQLRRELEAAYALLVGDPSTSALEEVRGRLDDVEEPDLMLEPESTALYRGLIYEVLMAEYVRSPRVSDAQSLARDTDIAEEARSTSALDRKQLAFVRRLLETAERRVEIDAAASESVRQEIVYLLTDYVRTEECPD